MSASSKLLLPPGILRGERKGKNRRPGRPTGARPPHSKKVEIFVEAPRPVVPERRRLYPSYVPPAPQAEATAAPPTCARWTHYGMWTDDGRQVLNEHGDVIYELP